MPVASFSGLASGIDSTALISGLVGIARQPITRLQKEQSTLSQQAARVDDLRSKLSTFRTAAQALNSTQEVLATKASSADATIVKVTAGADATTSAYDIHVTSLATSTRAYANPVAAKDQTGLFGTGTLSSRSARPRPTSRSTRATRSPRSPARSTTPTSARSPASSSTARTGGSP